MKHTFLTLLSILSMSIIAQADEVPGVTVEYIDSGSSNYVQAISAIGRIEFRSGDAIIVFKDTEAGEYELGAIADIKRISFANVSDGDITNGETPTSVADVERKVTVSAYPNPTADHVHIDGVAEGETIRIFSADGKLVLTSTERDINLSGVNNGVYFLQAGKEVVKIIKK